MIGPLEETTTARRFGAKVVNLRRVQEFGIAVPETYVLSRAALVTFLEESALGPAVSDYLRAEPSREGYTELCARLRKADLGAELVGEVDACSAELLTRSPYGIAVRSSALSEDSKVASFAGVFESKIALHSTDEVIEAIKQVWCSLWSPRAIRYATALGLTPAADEMAVMLQAVVPASFSGVMYTASPRTGDPNVIEIHGVEGLSLDLMSGSGQGASYEVDWRTGSVLDATRSQQRTKHSAGRSGLDATSLAAPGGLDPRQFAQLTAVAKKLDLAFGCRLDIEWALESDALSVLQARPLTALPDFFPIELDASERTRAWKHLHFTVPLRSDDAGNLITPLYDDIDEMELWFRHHPHDMIFTGPIFDTKELLGHRYGVELRHPTFIDHFIEHGWDQLEPWLRENEPRYYARWRQHDQELEELVDLATDASGLTTGAEELFPHWLNLRDRLFDRISFGWSAPQCMGWMFEALLGKFMTEAGVDFVPANLLAGSDTSFTFRFSRALQEFARQIKEPEVIEALCSRPIDAVLGLLRREQPSCEFLAGLDRLCWQYGKLPLGWYTRPLFWRRDESELFPLLMAIRSYLKGEASDVTEMQQQSLRACNAYREQLAARVQAAGASRDQFEWIVDRARIWTQALNDRHADLIVINWERELVWLLGTKLQGEQVIERPEQVLALTLADLRMLFKLVPDDQRALAQRRWQHYEYFLRLTPPPTLGEADSESASVTPAPQQESREFRGRGLSGDKIIGRARPVHDLYDVDWLDSLSSEDVLILREAAFDYADWHSIFTLIKGVASAGRPSHHLSQVARECRVSVVAYLEGDLGSIGDGVRVELDPIAGVLRLLSDTR